VTRLMASHQ